MMERRTKMTNESVNNAKSDAKKGIADLEKAGSYAKADANAGVEKIKANFGKSDVEKKVAYAKADIVAGAKKAVADVENKMAHAKADAEKAKSSSPPY
jgi:hypothetical protein